MLRAIVAGVMAAGVLAPQAHACTRLPARSATAVSIDRVFSGYSTERDTLRVCAGGRTVTLARATAHGLLRLSGRRIGAASAAGHRVAWIEERHRGGVGTAIVTVARVGRRVRVLRRFVAERERTREGADLDVLLARRGLLAWTAGTWGHSRGLVAFQRQGRPVHRLAGYPASSLGLEDGRTLRWEDDGATEHFFDLRREPCPSRSRYKELARDDRVILTEASYGDSWDGAKVIRGCDPATGRDRVILEGIALFDSADVPHLLGLDRNWAVFLEDSSERDAVDLVVIVVDGLTGHTTSVDLSTGAGLAYPPPSVAGGFAVSGRGVLGWLAGGALYALVGDEHVVTLDAGGVLAGLHAEGDALVWTHDGVPRRAQ
jgi:hypothetical protein